MQRLLKPNRSYVFVFKMQEFRNLVFYTGAIALDITI